MDNRCEKYFRVNIVVNPSSRENTIHISDDGAIKIRVTSPAESNKANSAAIELLPETIAIPKTNIQILRGKTQRKKLFTFYGETETTE